MGMGERQPLSPFPYLSDWYRLRILASLLAPPPNSCKWSLLNRPQFPWLSVPSVPARVPVNISMF